MDQLDERGEEINIIEVQATRRANQRRFLSWIHL